MVGACMGLFSGIVPGIHVNTLASMMLAFYPSIESAISGIVTAESVPLAVCCCIMSASVVHSFVDFVPSVFIGAPDSEDAISVLPGHRLMLSGRGMSAVRSAAIGSIIGASAAILLSIPLQFILIRGAESQLDRLTPLVLIVVSAILILGERRPSGMLWGLVAFIVSGALGLICMALPIPSDGMLGKGTLLFPMLTGLFGIPVLLDSSGIGASAKRQTDCIRDPVGILPGIKGVVMGCIAGWFPGITSTVGASVSASIFPEDGPERFISMVASIGTVTSVLSLVTLSVSGSGRSGTAIVIGEILGDSLGGFASEPFMVLLASTAMASVMGYGLTIASGRAMSHAVGRIDSGKLSRTVLILLLALTIALTGPFGLLVLGCSAVVGFLPQSFGICRTVLCGCLILPALIL